MQSINLTNQFLIAMPAMTDSYFAKSLVYVCEHNERGALGIIINRPLDITLGKLFVRVGIPLESPLFDAMPVYFGGPVQTDRGFVLHRPVGAWQAMLRVTDHIALTSSRDVLQAIGKEGQPQDLIVSLGYAGWSAGQLENEMLQNTWLSVPASESILFELPFEERLPAAMQTLGINFSSLSLLAGHA